MSPPLPAFVLNPRRAPRVPVRLQADVAWGSATWAATTFDLSATGCALQSDRLLIKGTRLSLLLRKEGLPAPLSVVGEVVWSRGGRFAVRFSGPHGGGGPQQWVEALLRAHPRLARGGNRLPPRLPTDAHLAVRREALVGQVIDHDEGQVVRAAGGGCTIAAAARQAGLPPERFARALYALVGKGIVTTPAAGPA